MSTSWHITIELPLVEPHGASFALFESVPTFAYRAGRDERAVSLDDYTRFATPSQVDGTFTVPDGLKWAVVEGTLMAAFAATNLQRDCYQHGVIMVDDQPEPETYRDADGCIPASRFDALLDALSRISAAPIGAVVGTWRSENQDDGAPLVATPWGVKAIRSMGDADRDGHWKDDRKVHGPMSSIHPGLLIAPTSGDEEVDVDLELLHRTLSDDVMIAMRAVAEMDDAAKAIDLAAATHDGSGR